MVVAIVQVRMGSSRLPGKVLKEILGKPVLWHLVNRLRRSRLIDKIVIATTVKNAQKWLWKESGVVKLSPSEPMPRSTDIPSMYEERQHTVLEILLGMRVPSQTSDFNQFRCRVEYREPNQT